MQSEVLALVAARNDAMAAALVLAALGLLAPREVRPGRLLLAGLLALGGLLSKESAILAVVMLGALDLARWRRPGPFRRYAVLGAAVCAYLPLRRMADLDAAITPDAGAFSLLADNAIAVAGVYGKLVVWPWPLTPARHINYLPPIGDTLFGLVVLGSLAGAAVWRGERRALVLAGGAWAIASFVPSLAATLDKGLLGERYLYLPLAGLALSLVGAAPRMPRWSALAIAAPSVLALQLRLPTWEDSRTVWQDAHDVAPTAFTAGGLAWYYHRDKDYEAANQLFRLALEGDPPYRDVCEMVVMSHLEARESAEAVRIGEWAIQERGCDPAGLITHHLAIALAGEGRWAEGAKLAANRPGGPEGPSIIVIAGHEARKGRQPGARGGPAAYPSDPTFLDRTARCSACPATTRLPHLSSGSALHPLRRNPHPLFPPHPDGDRHARCASRTPPPGSPTRATVVVQAVAVKGKLVLPNGAEADVFLCQTASGAFLAASDGDSGRVIDLNEVWWAGRPASSTTRWSSARRDGSFRPARAGMPAPCWPSARWRRASRPGPSGHRTRRGPPEGPGAKPWTAYRRPSSLACWRPATSFWPGFPPTSGRCRRAPRARRMARSTCC